MAANRVVRVSQILTVKPFLTVHIDPRVTYVVALRHSKVLSVSTCLKPAISEWHTQLLTKMVETRT